jgi:hypothetical protein
VLPLSRVPSPTAMLGFRRADGLLFSAVGKQELRVCKVAGRRLQLIHHAIDGRARALTQSRVRQRSAGTLSACSR